MNINNVTTILSISNKFNEKYSCAQKVKLMCLEFICKNISFVMETSSYKHACKNDKSLTQEILTAFENKHKKSSDHNLMSPQKRRFSLVMSDNAWNKHSTITHFRCSPCYKRIRRCHQTNFKILIIWRFL